MVLLIMKSPQLQFIDKVLCWSCELVGPCAQAQGQG